jgi:hypothetical protein
MVVAGGQLEERHIDVGLETPELVEVLSGLNEKDLVVIGNRSQLRAGMRVEPKPMDGLASGWTH